MPSLRLGAWRRGGEKMSLERLRTWAHRRKDSSPSGLIHFHEILKAIEICMETQEAEEEIENLNREKSDLHDELRGLAMNNHLPRYRIYERLAEIEYELHSMTGIRNGKIEKLKDV